MALPGSKILVTTLFNRALPLTGTYFRTLRLSKAVHAPAGVPYARVTAIEGRREDYMTLRALVGGSIRVPADAYLRAPLAESAWLASVPGRARREPPDTAGSRVRSGADVDRARASAEHVVRSALHEMVQMSSGHERLDELSDGAGTGARKALSSSAGRRCGSKKSV